VNKKHLLIISYNDDFDILTLKSSIASLLFSSYLKGKKYEQSKEVTAKIPILQMLLEPYFTEPFQKYIDKVNQDISGFSELVDSIITKMKELNGSKFEITFDVKKIS
jgi:hypothetical protein